MIPFHESMYSDDVVFFRSVPATGTMGDSKRTFIEPGEPMRAAVKSGRVDRTDARGRVSTTTIHNVRTPVDIAARADDKFEWLGRTLTVEAATIPKGIGDVTWHTQCVETR